MSIWLPRRPPSNSKVYLSNITNILESSIHRARLRSPAALEHPHHYSSLSSQRRRSPRAEPILPLLDVPSNSRQFSQFTPLHEEKQVSTSTGTEKTLAKPTEPQLPLKTRIWAKVKHEVLHFYHGSKLLGKEVRISSRLLLKLMRGGNLTRRENRQASSRGLRSMLSYLI